MRPPRALALAVALAVSGLLLLGGPPATSATPAPRVIVSPATGLVDGQHVWVFGTGLPARTSIGIAQCDSFEANDPDDGCSITQTVTSDAHGRVLSRFTLDASLVHGAPVGPGSPVFCRADH